jgi:hypothetical protein
LCVIFTPQRRMEPIENSQNFSDEILERFQKIVRNKKTSTSPKLLLARGITRQISSIPGNEEFTIPELNEKLRQLEEKILRRDNTIISLRREAAIAMLQTVDQTRLDGGISSIVDRVVSNVEKMNQYEDELINLKRDHENKINEISNLKKQFQINEKKFQNRINFLENENFEMQEKLKIYLAENKQKTVFLSGKDNLLEHQSEMLRKRDEKYLELEERYATLMVRGSLDCHRI